MRVVQFIFFLLVTSVMNATWLKAADNPILVLEDDQRGVPGGNPAASQNPPLNLNNRNGGRNGRPPTGFPDNLLPGNFLRGGPPQGPPGPQNARPIAGDLDLQLSILIVRGNLTGDPTEGRDLPNITSPLPTLGKHLFYSTRLGGEEDAACVSCHHPALGGGDALSLSVGVHAVDSQNETDSQLLGLGRHSEVAGSIPLVARNAPTTFNIGLWDRGLFWDSRVATIGRARRTNGTGSAITTPDSDEFNARDTNLQASTSLPAAQARFPVTSKAEMRADFASEEDNQALRAQLADRFAELVSGWSSLFELAFGSDEINFDRIADAIGEYERSMVFVESPWKRYVEGDQAALTDEQKQGAVLFFTPIRQGGAGCNRCHAGDTFTDQRHHIVGFPQTSNDLGRESVNGEEADRYHFRTASLLNVGATAPYGHSGLYQSLEEVVRHYDNPQRSVEILFGEIDNEPFFAEDTPFCLLPQIQRITEVSGEECATLFPDAFDNSELALQRMRSREARNPLGRTPNLNDLEVNELVAFLEALTDPCVESRECLDPWIVDSDDLGDYPDDSALVGHDEQKLDL